MSLLVKITLSAALILSIGVPFGAFAAGEKTRGRYKTALGANLFLFFGTMVIAAVLMFNGNAFAAEEAAFSRFSVICSRYGLLICSSCNWSFLSGRRYCSICCSQRSVRSYQ